MRSALLRLTICCLIAAVARAACPSNEWRPFRGKCYYASSFAVGGWNISEICNFGYPGSKSASVHDIDVNSFLASDMLGGQRAWMGLYRQTGHSYYHWEDGSSLDWIFWYSFPSGTYEECAAINYYAPTGQWAGMSCGTPLPFLCETYET